MPDCWIFLLKRRSALSKVSFSPTRISANAGITSSALGSSGSRRRRASVGARVLGGTRERGLRARRSVAPARRRWQTPAVREADSKAEAKAEADTRSRRHLHGACSTHRARDAHSGGRHPLRRLQRARFVRAIHEMNSDPERGAAAVRAMHDSCTRGTPAGRMMRLTHAQAGILRWAHGIDRFRPAARLRSSPPCESTATTPGGRPAARAPAKSTRRLRRPPMPRRPPRPDPRHRAAGRAPSGAGSGRGWSAASGPASGTRSRD